jgi:hypothetical protein
MKCHDEVRRGCFLSIRLENQNLFDFRVQVIQKFLSEEVRYIPSPRGFDERMQTAFAEKAGAF